MGRKNVTREDEKNSCSYTAFICEKKMWLHLLHCSCKTQTHIFNITCVFYNGVVERHIPRQKTTMELEGRQHVLSFLLD